MRVPVPSDPGMFGNFTKARRRKAPRWAMAVLGGAVVAHVMLFMALWIKTIWDIEHLDKPKTSIDLAIAPTPPPPPPPPPGGAKPHDPLITPKHPTVKDIVQPVRIERPQVQVVAEVGSGSGNNIDGKEGGTDPNSTCFDCDVGPPVPVAPPPPPPPVHPTNITQQALEASRIAGNKLIEPTDTTKTDIQRSGKSRLVGTFKLCLTAGGTIDSVSALKSTGFPAYDATITSHIRGEWRYRAFSVNGTPVPVCTAVTFIYSQ